MAVRDQDITIFAEETLTINVTSRDETDALVDFTGATITWKVVNGGTTILTKAVGSGITVTGSGTFTIALLTANTEGLAGEYQHECRAVLADGTVSTLFVGTFTVEPTLVT